MYWQGDDQETFEKFTRRRGVSSKRRWQLEERSAQALMRAGQAGCKKLTYSSKSDAEAARLRFISMNLPTAVKRAYRCPLCDNWHLTSKHQWRRRSRS